MKKERRANIWKHLLSMLLVFGLCLNVLDVTAFAGGRGYNTGTEGTCGDNLTWVLDSEGTLTISGTGEMEDDCQEWCNRTDIKSVVIQDGVENIGGEVFSGCTELKTVLIAESVTKIDYDAFYGCSSLKSITIPKSVKEIAGNVFASTKGLEEIKVDESNAFYDAIDGVLFNKDHTRIIAYPNAKGSTYEIPDSVKEIAAAAFFDCDGLTSITIPDSVNMISNGAFCGCRNLTTITMPHDMTWLCERAFSYCTSLKTIIIPNGVAEIGSEAFRGCSSLTNAVIPHGVNKISDHAFADCESLTGIAIPDSVTEIGYLSLGYYYSGRETKTYENFTIYGRLGTEAEAYAAKNGLAFVDISNHTHTYGEPIFSWSKKGQTYSVKADFVCTEYYDDIYTVSCDVSSETKEATSETDGQTVYTASVTWNGKTYTNTKTVIIPKKQASDIKEEDKKSDDTKTNGNITSIDTVKGTAQVTDLVAGINSEVPLAVVIEGAVYRMYNPNTGEHFYTKSSAERDYLIGSGWNYEENASFATIAADEEGAKPIYRVYNPNSGLHHYTMNHEEAIMLSNVGWNYEGISFYAFDKDSGIGSEQYRLYNPNDGQHHWTVDSNERDSLVSLGWNAEGTAWRVK